jgi:hypothetical protein
VQLSLPSQGLLIVEQTSSDCRQFSHTTISLASP